MIASLAFLIFLQICSANSKIHSESCEKSCFHRELFNSNSVIDELVNKVSAFAFESDRCKEELLLIKDGIRKKEIWAFKRKLQTNK